MSETAQSEGLWVISETQLEVESLHYSDLDDACAAARECRLNFKVSARQEKEIAAWLEALRHRAQGKGKQ